MTNDEIVNSVASDGPPLAIGQPPLATGQPTPSEKKIRVVVGMSGGNMVVADAPDADDLVELAARRGYLMWLFRPVRGGIWGEYADDATLIEDGGRKLPCPLRPIPPTCEGSRKTVYRFGVPATNPLLGSH